MGAMTPDDIKLTVLKRMNTNGGDVLHAMKHSDIGFSGFGEAYFSCVNPLAVKAWKRHKRMTLNLVVPVGTVKFVFFIENKNGKTLFRTEEVGETNYVRLTIPPRIWFGFQGLGKSTSLILNIADISHEEGEVERASIPEFNFEWN